jgi:hypothetical protein
MANVVDDGAASGIEDGLPLVGPERASQGANDP